MIGLTSPTHLALLLLIALLLFGAKRVPEIGRSLGSGMREFKDSVSGGKGSDTHTETTATTTELPVAAKTDPSPVSTTSPPQDREPVG